MLLYYYVKSKYFPDKRISWQCNFIFHYQTKINNSICILKSEDLFKKYFTILYFKIIRFKFNHIKLNEIFINYSYNQFYPFVINVKGLLFNLSLKY